MRLMDHYISKQLMDFFLICLVVFTLLLFFSDALFDFMKDLQHYGITWDVALTIIGLQIPSIIALVIPMSALLSTLLVYSSMNNQHELIALRMNGISLYRLAMPAFVLGVGVTIVAYVLYDYVRPLCNTYQRALKLYTVHELNLPAVRENFIYKQYDDKQHLQRLIYVSEFKKQHLGHSTVMDLTNPNTVQITQAGSGDWLGQSIRLNDASVYTVTTTGKLMNTASAQHLHLENFLTPMVEMSFYKPKELSFIQLVQWIRRQPEKVDRKVLVTLWEKISIPLSTLPLTMIAVPLAISAPRRLRSTGYIAAIAILFLYYLLRHSFIQLTVMTNLLPFLGAFIPVVIISLITLLLFVRKNHVL